MITICLTFHQCPSVLRHCFLLFLTRFELDSQTDSYYMSTESYWSSSVIRDTDNNSNITDSSSIAYERPHYWHSTNRCDVRQLGQGQRLNRGQLHGFSEVVLSQFMASLITNSDADSDYSKLEPNVIKALVKAKAKFLRVLKSRKRSSPDYTNLTTDTVASLFEARHKIRQKVAQKRAIQESAQNTDSVIVESSLERAKSDYVDMSGDKSSDRKKSETMKKKWKNYMEFPFKTRYIKQDVAFSDEAKALAEPALHSSSAIKESPSMEDFGDSSSSLSDSSTHTVIRRGGSESDVSVEEEKKLKGKKWKNYVDYPFKTRYIKSILKKSPNYDTGYDASSSSLTSNEGSPDMESKIHRQDVYSPNFVPPPPPSVPPPKPPSSPPLPPPPPLHPSDSTLSLAFPSPPPLEQIDWIYEAPPFGNELRSCSVFPPPPPPTPPPPCSPLRKMEFFDSDFDLVTIGSSPTVTPPSGTLAPPPSTSGPPCGTLAPPHSTSVVHPSVSAIPPSVSTPFSTTSAPPLPVSAPSLPTSVPPLVTSALPPQTSALCQPTSPSFPTSVPPPPVLSPPSAPPSSTLAPCLPTSPVPSASAPPPPTSASPHPASAPPPPASAPPLPTSAPPPPALTPPPPLPPSARTHPTSVSQSSTSSSAPPPQSLTALPHFHSENPLFLSDSANSPLDHEQPNQLAPHSAYSSCTQDYTKPTPNTTAIVNNVCADYPHVPSIYQTTFPRTSPYGKCTSPTSPSSKPLSPPKFCCEGDYPSKVQYPHLGLASLYGMSSHCSSNVPAYAPPHAPPSCDARQSCPQAPPTCQSCPQAPPSYQSCTQSPPSCQPCPQAPPPCQPCPQTPLSCQPCPLGPPSQYFTCPCVNTGGIPNINDGSHRYPYAVLTNPVMSQDLIAWYTKSALNPVTTFLIPTPPSVPPPVPPNRNHPKPQIAWNTTPSVAFSKSPEVIPHLQSQISRSKSQKRVRFSTTEKEDPRDSNNESDEDEESTSSSMLVPRLVYSSRCCLNAEYCVIIILFVYL